MYKKYKDSMMGEIQREPENEHDRQAVCVLKSGTNVGHVPRELSRLFWFRSREEQTQQQ